MIISDEHRFAFIHIPKCAGSSVRRALGPIDTTGEAFFRIGDHPKMGPVHFAHLTLADLKDHYPETFDKLRCYRTMAIVRDPIERFYSAVFQRLREFKLVAQSAIGADLIEADALAAIAAIENAPDRLDLEHVHFNRQCDFIELNGERILRDIFPLSRMADAARYVQELTGIDITSDRENWTVELRFAPLRPIQRLLRDHYARLVPADRRTAIRERMVRAGFYSEVPKASFIHRGGRIEAFIRAYYARDFEILREFEAHMESAA